MCESNKVEATEPWNELQVNTIIAGSQYTSRSAVTGESPLRSALVLLESEFRSEWNLVLQLLIRYVLRLTPNQFQIKWIEFYETSFHQNLPSLKSSNCTDNYLRFAGKLFASVTMTTEWCCHSDKNIKLLLWQHHCSNRRFVPERRLWITGICTSPTSWIWIWICVLIFAWMEAIDHCEGDSVVLWSTIAAIFVYLFIRDGGKLGRRRSEREML